MTLQTVGVYAATASTGVCLHLVFLNTCQVETYSDTCIETTGNAQGWQCWTSSVVPGSTLDVSECDTNGKYFFVSTESSGLLDSLEPQCAAPLS